MRVNEGRRSTSFSVFVHVALVLLELLLLDTRLRVTALQVAENMRLAFGLVQISGPELQA